MSKCESKIFCEYKMRKKQTQNCSNNTQSESEIETVKQKLKPTAASNKHMKNKIEMKKNVTKQQNTV